MKRTTWNVRREFVKRLREFLETYYVNFHTTIYGETYYVKRTTWNVQYLDLWPLTSKRNGIFCCHVGQIFQSTFLGSLERADHPNYNYSELISLCQLITHIEADTNTETVRQIVSRLLVNLRVIVEWLSGGLWYGSYHCTVASLHDCQSILVYSDPTTMTLILWSHCM